MRCTHQIATGTSTHSSYSTDCVVRFETCGSHSFICSESHRRRVPCQRRLHGAHRRRVSWSTLIVIAHLGLGRPRSLSDEDTLVKATHGQRVSKPGTVKRTHKVVSCCGGVGRGSQTVCTVGRVGCWTYRCTSTKLFLAFFFFLKKIRDDAA